MLFGDLDTKLSRAQNTEAIDNVHFCYFGASCGSLFKLGISEGGKRLNRGKEYS